MNDKVLMIINGSQLLSNTWKQELQIREDGVYGEVLVVGKRIKMHLPYESVAQVNIINNIFSADIEIINKGGSSNLVIKAVKKSEAEKAKEMIEQKRVEFQSLSKIIPSAVSQADEIKKLANLRDSNILSEEEFNAKKKQILGL